MNSRFLLCNNRVDTHPGNSGKSGNFKIIDNLRETKGILIFYLNSGRLRTVLIFYKKFREVLRFFQKSQGKFFLDLE